MASPTEPAGAGVDWEARWQAGDTPWDKGTAAPPLVDWLARHPVSGRVLVPGCGSGHDVRALAAAGADVLGLDLSPTALAHAASFPPVAGERYRLENLFTLPPELHGTFDAVFEHTCFCAIDPARRADYVAAVHAALRPGGHLLAIFYLDPGPEPGPPHGVTPAELDALFAGFHLEHQETPARAFAGRERRERLRLLHRL